MFAKYILEPFIKQKLQAINPDEVRYFKKERARLFKEWDGALNNSQNGSNPGSQNGFQNGSISQSSSADARVPTETVSNRAPTAAKCLQMLVQFKYNFCYLDESVWCILVPSRRTLLVQSLQGQGCLYCILSTDILKLVLVLPYTFFG